MRATTLAFFTSTTLVLSLAVAGCGDGGGGDDDGGGTPDAAPGTPDAGGGGDWVPIIESDWSLQPGEEKYSCASITLTEDTYIGGYRPIDPVGTHHTVLSFGAPQGADNPGYDCGPGEENPLWIYASGVGTNELVLPAGVGMVIQKGQQVHVNLHLYNTTDAVMTGRSGVEIMKLAKEQVVHEAEMFLPGPVAFQNTPTDTISGNCKVNAAQTLVALFPHMHQKGKHFKTEVLRGGQTIATLYDKDYNFDNQEFVLVGELALQPNDTIRTTCQWTQSGINWGDSSDQEMCFSILIRYPRLNNGGSPICAF